MKSSTHLLTLIATLTTVLNIPQNFSAEVNPDFNVQINGTVHALLVDGSGAIFAGGEFSEVNGVTRNNFVRLEASGVIDPGFSLSADGVVLTLAGSPDGSVYMGGAFNSPGRHLARVLPTGAVAPLGIGSSTSSQVDCLAVGADGSVTFGGPFRKLDGADSVYVGKISAGGAIDSGFFSGLLSNFSIEAGADAIAVQPDGKVIVGGNVSTANGLAYLVRLNGDGSIDETFSGDHGAILYTKAIVVLEDGGILAAGVANSSGEGFVRRLNPDGSVDASFQAPQFDDAVEALAVDSDGGVFVGGSFSGGLARLNRSGAVDASFNVSTDGAVKSLALRGTDALVVGGAFQEIGGLAQSGIAWIKLEPKSQSTFATNANGRFHAQLEGEDGRLYEIDASTDLKNWGLIATARATSDGIEINEQIVAGRNHRFFRARLIQ
ncbi:MAG: hypothetical protein ACXW3Z_11865 [Limisphaerales bacterium]